MTDAPQSAGLIALAERIELWPIDRLRPFERNPRTHSEAQVDQIAASVVEFGWTNPILIDESAGILAGHGRLLAARKLGLAEVQLADMTFCDPPYNVDYANSPKDKLRGKHRPILNDDLGGGFEAFLYDACVNILSVSAQAKLVLTAHEVYLPKPKLAVEGPGGVQASFDFRGAKNDIASRMLTVTLTNDLDGSVYA